MHMKEKAKGIYRLPDSRGKSKGTVQKYTHDIGHFFAFAENREVTKQPVIEYKKDMAEKIRSVP